ncbi:TRAP transporter small permease [Desulfatirhabdium butyrativorans]|uniref:TRAP transporter small permease n=1 Tax=Desulfatirhabdium butyrativorans TaxID=340467 RepID=UPI00041B76FE|nr:TRAP transporter small permease subunit [Desulfatirhabdium butyrativorans]
MIAFLEIQTNRIAVILYWIAGAAIVAMMLLTCADVLLRYAVTLHQSIGWSLLSGLKPIPGTFELASFLGAVAAACAMAHTAIKKGHVAVSFAVELLPERYRRIMEGLTHTFSLLLFVLLSWQAFVYGGNLRESGEVSPTLQLPFYIFVYGIGVASIAVCLVLSLDLVKIFRRIDNT